jgi:competence protein ComEA
MILIKGDHMKKIILLSAFILTIAFGLCGCKKDDATVHFASETEQTAVVSSDVNRQTADSKEKKASSDGKQEQKAKDIADDTDESTEWCVYICGQVANPGVYRVKPGARVCELVDMAGGMLDTADKSFWNLASELYDGQMLYFPTITTTVCATVLLVHLLLRIVYVTATSHQHSCTYGCCNLFHHYLLG